MDDSENARDVILHPPKIFSDCSSNSTLGNLCILFSYAVASAKIMSYMCHEFMLVCAEMYWSF